MRKLSQINEGLWNKGVERSKYGIVRMENSTPLDVVCESVGKMMSEVMNISYTPDLCTHEPSKMSKRWYYVIFNFSEVDESFSKITVEIDPSEQNKNIDEIYNDFLNNFTYIRTRDSISNSPHFNKLNEVIKQIVFKLKKHIPSYNGKMK